VAGWRGDEVKSNLGPALPDLWSRQVSPLRRATVRIKGSIKTAADNPSSNR